MQITGAPLGVILFNFSDVDLVLPVLKYSRKEWLSCSDQFISRNLSTFTLPVYQYRTGMLYSSYEIR